MLIAVGLADNPFLRRGCHLLAQCGEFSLVVMLGVDHGHVVSVLAAMVMLVVLTMSLTAFGLPTPRRGG